MLRVPGLGFRVLGSWLQFGVEFVGMMVAGVALIWDCGTKKCVQFLHVFKTYFKEFVRIKSLYLLAPGVKSMSI